MQVQSGYLKGAIKVLKEKYHLDDSEIYHQESPSVLRDGTKVLICEIFTSEDNQKVCLWIEKYVGENVLINWFEYTQPTFSEFMKELDKQTENSLFLTLCLKEQSVNELRLANQKLLEENKRLREEIMELLYAPGGKGAEIAKRHFEELSQ